MLTLAMPDAFNGFPKAERCGVALHLRRCCTRVRCLLRGVRGHGAARALLHGALLHGFKCQHAHGRACR
jgi:hypothetical protein